MKPLNINQICLLYYPEQEKNPEFWNTMAQRTLKTALSVQNLNKNKAKNLILFLGDGKSLKYFLIFIRGKKIWMFFQ